MIDSGRAGAIRRRYLVSAVVLLSLGFIAGGLLFYRSEANQIRREKYLDISTIAEFKVNQIRQWRQERLADVSISAQSPFLVRVMESWPKTPDTDSQKKDVRKRLELERTYNGYTDMLLVSPTGDILLSLEGRPAPLSAEDRQAMAESLERRGAALSELYRTGSGAISIDSIAPVMSGQGRHLAFLIYRIDANAYLYPLIRSWPGPSRSAESLLVRRDGNGVLFLNELRHRSDTALSFRYPLARTDVPAVQAVLGKQGMFRGKDYRDVEVVADLRPIPQSSWFIVAKIDAGEVLAEATWRAGFISFAVFLFLLLIAFIAAYAYRHRQAYFYKTLYRFERAERESRELFRTTLYSIGDAVVTTDEGGMVRHMNPVAEKITGWTEPEAQGRPIQEVFPIINEHTRSDVESPVAHVLKAGTVVGLANHTLLVSKDGTEYPIADSGAPIIDENGAVIGVVLVFRDQTEERRAEEVLRESKTRLDLALQSAHMGVWQWDIVEDRRHFDNLACVLLGIDAETFTGSAKEFFDVVHPFDREELAGALDRTIATDLLYQPEYRVVWRDGSIHHIAARARLVRDETDMPVRLNGIIWEVTEQKKIEEALRESEAKFRSYVESSPIAVFVADREGHIVEVNRSATELLGYDAATLAHMYVWDLHPAQDAETVRLGFSHLIRNGCTEAEHRLQRQDGSLVWVLLHATTIEDGRSIAYYTDITGRKQAEEALKRYELLSGNSRDIILFMERDSGRIVEANKAAEKTYGYSRKELLGLTVRDLRAPETAGLTDSQMAEADARGTLFETIHRRKDGSTFPVEVSSRGATIGETPVLISIIRDIAKRRQNEEEIRLLKHSIDVHYDGAYWMDADNRFVYVNDAGCKALGYGRDELVGKTLYDVNSDATPEAMNGVWERLRKEGSYVGEALHRRKDGSEFPAEIVTTYVQFGGREFACGFARDVTEKRRIEEQFRQAQKMEAIGTLAGGVAHDFNNILTVIMGLSNLVQMSIDPNDRIRPHLDQIVVSSERAAELTKSLLAFSRKQKIVVASHRVGGVVASTAKLLKRLLPEDVELKIDLGDRDAVAMLDVAQIDQVLMNLATNARDAMPHGGTLTIKTERAEIDEAFEKAHGFGRPGTYVKLSVSDTGTGMDEKTVARIFDPFFTTKEVGKGTGLGLASVYGIVKQHDGYITVASGLLEGTTFDIYLPLAEATDPLATVAGFQFRGGSETILVIEDDPDVRNMVKIILSDHGYTTLEAASGDEALRIFGKNREKVGLIILDVVMPGRNGREVLDEIIRIDSSAKAIFMSGYTGDVVLDKGVKKESVDFLQKPLSVPNLLMKVREVLDR